MNFNSGNYNVSYTHFNLMNSILYGYKTRSAKTINYDASKRVLKMGVSKINDPIIKRPCKRKAKEDLVYYQNKKLCTGIHKSSSSTTQSAIGNNKRKNFFKNDKLQTKIISNSFEKFHNTFQQIEHSYPHRLINFMYQLELSVLCLLRKSTVENSSDPVIFKRSKIGQLNNIVMRFEEKHFCIKVQHVDTQYVKKNLTFNSLYWTKEGNFALKNYLNEFATELLCHPNRVSHPPEYLIIYTNCTLDLTVDEKLNRTEVGNPLQLCSVNSETRANLSNLFANNRENCEFYRFSSDAKTRNQLSHVLKFRKNVKSEISTKNSSLERIRHIFLENLIFAVNQPTMEELVDIVRSQVEKNNKDFAQLRKEVMNQLMSQEETEITRKAENLLSAVYSFNLFLCCIHDMFLDKNILSVKFIEKSASHDVAINFGKTFLYFKILDVDIKLSFKEFTNQTKMFSINSLFAFFIRELSHDLDYFVIYTNGVLTLVRDLILGDKCEPKKKVKTIFRRVNSMEKVYFELRHSCIDVNNIYRFSRGETREILLNLLEIPMCFKSGKFSHLDEQQTKEMFLDKIVFAVRQHNSEEMYKGLEKKIESDPKLPYDFKNLQKIAFHCLESHEVGAVTKKVMLTLCDEKLPKPVENKSFQEEIEFAKVLVLAETPEFNRFMDFLTKHEGKVCFDHLRRNGIEIPAVARIMQGTKKNAVTETFRDLDNLWFDRKGDKSKFFNTFEQRGFSVNNISRMLSGSGCKTVKTLKNLYQLWFDDLGDTTNYLRSLENEGINSSIVSDLLTNSGADCVDRFKTLHALWFNPDGTKTPCLKNLEENEVDLKTVCDILAKSGRFENLYKLWFDENGRKTANWKRLEESGIRLKQVCGILKGSGKNAEEAFKKLHNLWFDANGRKTLYFATLENERVNLAIIFDILVKTGINVSSIFQNLYAYWFDENGKKTRCLQIFETRGKRLPEICGLLKNVCGEGRSATREFKKLFYSPNAEIDETNRVEVQVEMKREQNEESTIFNNTENTIKNEKTECENYYEMLTDDSASVEPKTEELSQESKNFDKEGLKRKLSFLCNLFPAWRKNRSQTKMERVVKKIIHLINNARKLKSFLEMKLLKNKINQVEFDDTYSLIFDGPFTTTGLENFLVIKRKSSSSHRNETKFAKIVFSDENNVEFQELLNFLIEEDGRCLQVLEKNKISLKHVAKVFKGISSARKVIKSFRALFMLWFDETDDQKNCLKTLRRANVKVRSIIKILGGAGIHAEQTFQDLHHLWFDESGNKTHYLKSFEANGIKVKSIQKVFKDSGANAIAAFRVFHDLCFDTEGEKTKFLCILETEGIHLRAVIKIFKNTATKAGQIFLDLFNLWFDLKGNKTERLQNLEKNGIGLSCIVDVLAKKGTKAPEAFESLYSFVFDEGGKKRDYLTNLERKTSIEKILEIMTGYETNFNCIKELHDLWYDAEGNANYGLQILEESGVDLECLLSVLKGTGSCACEIFIEFILDLFDKTGNKTMQMNNIENVVELRAMFEMISGAEKRAYKAFLKLYNLWFDSQGKKTNRLLTLEENEISLMEISRILSGSGHKAAKRFKRLSECVTKRKLKKFELFIKLFEKK